MFHIGSVVAVSKLSFKPFLPKKWESYDFKINYRGRLIDILIDQSGITLTLEEGENLTIELFEEDVTLSETVKRSLA